MTHLLIDLIKHPMDILAPVIERKGAELTPTKTPQRKRTKPIDERVLRSTFNSSVSSTGSNRHLTPDELLDQLEFGSTGVRSRSTSIMQDSIQASPTHVEAPLEDLNIGAEDVEQPNTLENKENGDNDDILDIIEGHRDSQASYASNEVAEEEYKDASSLPPTNEENKAENIPMVDTDIANEHVKEPKSPELQTSYQLGAKEEDDEDAPPAFVTAAIEADKPVDDEEENGGSKRSSFVGQVSRDNSFKTSSNRSSLNRGTRVKKNNLKIANP